MSKTSETASPDAVVELESVAGPDVASTDDSGVQRETPDAPKTDGPVVKYIGQASIRQILQKEWASVGVDQETAIWSRGNGYAIEKSAFSQAALDILAADGAFKFLG